MELQVKTETKKFPPKNLVEFQRYWKYWNRLAKVIKERPPRKGQVKEEAIVVKIKIY